MTREELIEVIANAIYNELEGPVANQDFGRQSRQWDQCLRIARTQIAAIEAAGVRLIHIGKAQVQLIDGDERTSFTIFSW